MILSKQIVLFTNIVHIGIKQTMTDDFKEEGFNLTPEQFLVMDTLWDEGVLTQQQIANITMRDKNSIVKLIDGLENRKLVKRVSNPKDRRQNLIRVTPYSLKIREKVNECAFKSVESIIKGISEEELETFIGILAKLEKNMYPKSDLLSLAKKYPSNKKKDGEAI
ncbi:MAG: MarR family transcriptional regulator [Bacteroidales bacterium]|jgi:DNA-binding MarR family transcriptional regulator|nr:MarR family transcriptional regulator [Bacteroidales bacterium]MCI2134829.1 MarR family transcriptional regulator [Bacteroidales bacterium]MDY6320676.1 MarR family transcriptional regulator [Bacteroidales bacterium]MEE3391479.1 MarR family transcriptional regulator [Candidatus Cryptobacteroides sp.]MEE3430375.1 MarR family transcriptional regulator [Candidatus Cryptobacteroides sp.]